MVVDNSYYYFQKALSPDDCKKIIDLGLSKIPENAETAGYTSKGDQPNAEPQKDKTLEELKKETGVDKEIEKKTYIRDSEVSWLDDKWLYDLIMPLVFKANKDAGWKYDLEYNESFQFTVYRPGGFYGWHSDGGGDHNAKFKRYIPGIDKLDDKGKIPTSYTNNNKMVGLVRKLSCTINLNNPGEYMGGNLKFDFGPHSQNERYHECEEIRPQGSIVVFPSFVHHQVTPVTRGTRYSLVLWALGRPFK